MASSSINGSSLCTICFEPVLDDNSRGRAHLVCGHFFHLDCIGKEFNYKRAMVCPNCRVTEHGHWGSPSPDYEELDLNMTPRFDYDMYEVSTVDDTSVAYRQLTELLDAALGSLENLPMVDPIVQYHQNAAASPPPESVHHVPIHADALLRASGISAYDARMERVILHEPERSYTAQMRSSYDSHSHGPYDSPALEVEAMFDRSIRNPNWGAISLPTNEASELSTTNTDLSLALVPSTSSSDDPSGDAARRGA